MFDPLEGPFVAEQEDGPVGPGADGHIAHNLPWLKRHGVFHAAGVECPAL